MRIRSKDIATLPACNDEGDTNVVVETPRGSAVKLKYNPEFQTITLLRALPMGLVYPWDWGFVPSTLGENRNLIDVLLLHDKPTAPGLILSCLIVGVVEVRQSNEKKKSIRNDRLIAVPRTSQVNCTDARHLPMQLRQEIEEFLVATDASEEKTIKFLGWKGPKAGQRLIERAAQAFHTASVGGLEALLDVNLHHSDPKACGAL